jgi:voltage-gated potassium channel
MSDIMENEKPLPTPFSPYQMFILVLCIAALVLLGLQMSNTVDSETKVILESADLLICAVFFADFVYLLIRSPDRLRYLRTWGWIDLISSIPIAGPLRIGRAARLARILRALRTIRSIRLFAQIIAMQRSQSAFFSALVIALFLFVCSSVAILQFEISSASNIKTAQDAMWWSVTTMSTVGYGDFYPVTPEGRVVAVLLMVGGVGVFGTFSALMATWMLSAKRDHTSNGLRPDG